MSRDRGWWPLPRLWSGRGRRSGEAHACLRPVRGLPQGGVLLAMSGAACPPGALVGLLFRDGRGRMLPATVLEGLSSERCRALLTAYAARHRLLRDLCADAARERDAQALAGRIVARLSALDRFSVQAARASGLLA